MEDLLREWLDSKVGLVDLRPNIEYVDHHIKGSTNIPLDEYPSRTQEMPVRGEGGTIIGIVANSEIISKIKEFIGVGYNVKFAFNSESDELWKAVEQRELLERGNISRRLWNPCPFLEELIPLIEQSLAKNVLIAADVACGSGRDSIFLGTRGWSVVSVDRDEVLLRKISESAKRLGLEGKILPVSCDLEPEVITEGEDGRSLVENDATQTPNLTISPLSKQSNELLNFLLHHTEYLTKNLSPTSETTTTPNTDQNNSSSSSSSSPSLPSITDNYQKGYNLVHVARYLHRPLFPVIRSLVNPGGFVVFHSFMTPSLGKPRRPRFLLNPDELKRWFVGWEIIKYKEDKLSDGRPVQYLCARKPHL